MEDLNAASVEAAMRMVEGTARSMGVCCSWLIKVIGRILNIR